MIYRKPCFEYLGTYIRPHKAAHILSFHVMFPSVFQVTLDDLHGLGPQILIAEGRQPQTSKPLLITNLGVP